MLTLYIILATIIGSIFSLIGAFVLAYLQKKGRYHSFSLQLTSFAAGVMLTTALLHLGPEAAHEGLSISEVFSTIFGAIFFFFLLERLIWFHHHHATEIQPKPVGMLVTVGDTVHNFIDGVAIAGAFLIDIRLGIVTTLAVGFHEIPQEIADFVTMLKSGMTPRKAILLNLFSSLSALVGAIGTIIFVSRIEFLLPYLIAFSAGMFLYIALSDLLPELHHHEANHSEQWQHLLWFVLGIFLMAGVTMASERLAPHEEENEEIHIEESSESN